MKEHSFKRGDLVSVIDNTTRGKIIAIHGRRITIEDEFGFTDYYNANQLIAYKQLEDSFLDLVVVKDKVNKTVKKNSKTSSNKDLEVDLHIHQITITNKNMSNFEMLQYQLNYAKQKLKFAIKNKIAKVIFIHGKGKGVLRKELLHMLQQFPVEIKDASYQKYGFGAVEVKIFLSRTQKL